VPKQVDPDARRRDVVDALFRIVVRDGLQRVSLRSVADEARLNIGSLRHYFTGQQDLMRFAMQSVIDRTSARLLRHIADAGDLAHLSHPEQRRRTADALSELLPLDDVRHTEVTVYVEFINAARTNPALIDLAHKAALGTRFLVRRCLSRLQQNGAVRGDLDIDTETERLTVLVDGLSLNAACSPDILSAEISAGILYTHLDGLRPPTE
jgi:AcrR family transcriptional regulator